MESYAREFFDKVERFDEVMNRLKELEEHRCPDPYEKYRHKVIYLTEKIQRLEEQLELEKVHKNILIDEIEKLRKSFIDEAHQVAEKSSPPILEKKDA